jgi:hypothetical protein
MAQRLSELLDMDFPIEKLHERVRPVQALAVTSVGRRGSEVHQPCMPLAGMAGWKSNHAIFAERYTLPLGLHGTMASAS